MFCASVSNHKKRRNFVDTEQNQLMGGRGRVPTYINILLVASTYYLCNNRRTQYFAIEYVGDTKNQPLTSTYCTLRPQLFNETQDLNETHKLLYSPVTQFAGKCARYISQNVVFYMSAMQHHIVTGFYIFSSWMCQFGASCKNRVA